MAKTGFIKLTVWQSNNDVAWKTKNFNVNKFWAFYPGNTDPNDYSNEPEIIRDAQTIIELDDNGITVIVVRESTDDILRMLETDV